MDKDKVLGALANANVVRFGEFTLVSGEKSPIYVDLRVLPSHPWEFDIVTDGLAELVEKSGAEIVAGIETAGIPLSAAVAVKIKKPMVYIRKKAKEYGTASRVEGVVEKGSKVILIDDLMTRATSKIDAINAVREAGAKIEDLAIVLDREQGGEKELRANKVKLHKLVTLKELLAYMLNKGSITQAQHSKVLAYLGQ